jgi:hypothetical protein
MERGELDMAFTYAYSLSTGSGTPEAPDFDLTAAATYTPVIGDMVKFDANGKVVAKHVVGDGASSKLGVSLGTNFIGLQTSGVNGAVTSSIYNPSLLGKVIADPDAVYRVPISSASAIVVGTTYGITTVSGDQQLDPAATAANNRFLVVDFDRTAVAGAANGVAFVTIQSTNRLFG